MSWFPLLLAAAPVEYESSRSYSYSYETSSIPMGVWVFYGLFVLLLIVSMCKIFAKAGRPWWAAIIPFYSAWVLAEIAGKPGWWGLLTIIPFVGLVFAILILIELAKRFGKGAGFAVGMILLPMVFTPILAFGSAKYEPAVT
jgi:hypothetical protein